MTGVAIFGKILGSCLLASALHELTHYLTAVAVGREARFDIREWAVLWEVEHGERIGLQDWAIVTAPIAVGLLAAAGALLAFGVIWWLIPAWYLYTLHGAITNDLAMNEYDADERGAVSDAN